ncbi:PREDICTED: neuroendocrine convertase 1-like [Polistes dominula]|uniref:Neuroendocrine convertase 1-like n=1 Tax=Polistes dominula TaxID=743375 RepID=A0ABM1I831_POLDO|nr:PREDICTED: neuroendocrine convertase 1-like [Polistes dominula]
MDRRIIIHRLIFIQFILIIFLCVYVKTENYQNEWVLRINGGSHVAYLLAKRFGYTYFGPVRGFEDTYIWIKDNKLGQKKRGYVSSRMNFNSSSRISWVEQQKIVHREKRDYVLESIIDSEKPLIREKRFPWNLYGITSNIIDNRNKNKTLFNDELWDLEWYLQDTRSSKQFPKLDLNVLPVYELGITGRGIRIAVLDDGLEYDHDDLRNNYDPNISYNVNEGTTNPMPRYESTGMNAHGTRCAGEIAMEANNGKCGVGVAFEASIGGIKLLDGLVNDRVEGEALGFKPEIVDIYTASWGPPDDGKSLEAPGRLASEAIYRGINKGRNGKGSIYVWASGNGGSKYDNCGCDGYVGSIYTIAIGSASQTGKSPWYSEKCPAILATTYSSGEYQDQMIATTDLRNTCTTKHTGTSASAPLAAGILALVLQTNQNLTWRDIQHLIVWTSEYTPLKDNSGWLKNGAGFWYNLHFGFGLMNAYTLVNLSNNWINVPQKELCEIPMEFVLNRKLIHGIIKTISFEVNDHCFNGVNEINFLEHVEIEVNLEYTRRGVLEMYLVAPSGTKVQLLSPRKLDDSSEGFNKWKFMSVASWGEDPHGIWFLHIFDKIGSKKYNGTIGKFKLILHGTKFLPYYRKYGSRIYSNE